MTEEQKQVAVEAIHCAASETEDFDAVYDFTLGRLYDTNPDWFADHEGMCKEVSDLVGQYV